MIILIEKHVETPILKNTRAHSGANEIDARYWYVFNHLYGLIDNV